MADTDELYVVVARVREGGGWRERVHGVDPDDLPSARERAALLRVLAAEGGRAGDTYRVCRLVDVPDTDGGTDG